MNKKILFSIFFLFFFFFLTINNVSGYTYNTILDDEAFFSPNFDFFINGSIGNQKINFNDNTTSYDLDNCENNFANLTLCSRVSVQLELFNFVYVRQSLWFIEERNSSVIILVRDSKGNFEEIFIKSGFDTKNNTGSFSCGTFYTCFTDNRSIFASFDLSGIDIRNVFITVKVSGYTTTGSGGLGSSLGNIVREYGGTNRINVESVSSINFTIDQSKPYNASIGERFIINVTYGTSDNLKRACLEIIYSQNNISECEDNEFIDGITFTSITNNSFIVNAHAEGYIGSSFDEKNVQYTFNENFTTGKISTFTSTPLICTTQFTNLLSMKENFQSGLISSICKETKLLTIPLKGSLINTVGLTSGGDGSNSVIGYRVYGDFSTDANLSTPTNVRIFNERLQIGGSQYFYGVWSGSNDLGVTPITASCGGGGSLTITAQIYKAGTACNSGNAIAGHTFTYVNSVGLPVDINVSCDFGNSITNFCFAPAVGFQNLSSFYFGGSLANSFQLGPSANRTIVYGKIATIGLDMIKDVNSRNVTSTHKENISVYEYHNESELTDNNIINSQLSNNAPTTRLFSEFAPYSVILGGYYKDLEMSLNPLATFLIDDSTTETPLNFDIEFITYNGETGELLTDTEIQFIGDNFLEIQSVSGSSVTLNLPAGEISIRAIKTDENNTIIFDSNIQLVIVDQAKTVPIFLFPKIDPDGYTIFYLRVFDGVEEVNNFIEYRINTDCGTFNTEKVTQNKATRLRIINPQLPSRNPFQCSFNIKSLNGISILNVNKSVLKNEMNVFIFDVEDLVEDGEFIAPEITVDVSETGFTQIQIDAFSILFNSIWALIVTIAGGSGLIIALILMFIEIVLMNFGGKTVPNDIQLAVIGITFIGLIITGLLNPVLGILFIVVLGVLFGKKFHEQFGSSGEE